MTPGVYRVSFVPWYTNSATGCGNDGASPWTYTYTSFDSVGGVRQSWNSATNVFASLGGDLVSSFGSSSIYTHFVSVSPVENSVVATSTATTTTGFVLDYSATSTVSASSGYGYVRVYYGEQGYEQQNGSYLPQGGQCSSNDPSGCYVDYSLMSGGTVQPVCTAGWAGIIAGCPLDYQPLPSYSGTWTFSTTTQYQHTEGRRILKYELHHETINYFLWRTDTVLASADTTTK